MVNYLNSRICIVPQTPIQTFSLMALAQLVCRSGMKLTHPAKNKDRVNYQEWLQIYSSYLAQRSTKFICSSIHS